MPKLTSNYETVFIVSTKNGEEEISKLTDKFKALIAENGTVNNVEDWGKKKLAYEINDEGEGYYTFIEFSSNPDFPKELDRVYKITDGILRSLIIAK